MGLASVLVDRAAPVIREPAGARVEGRTIKRTVEGDDFKCRLDFGPMGDSNDGAVGVPVVNRTATMIYAVRDLKGIPVLLDAGMRVRITSRSLKLDELFDVAGSPEPIRKKRRQIAWQVEIRHVVAAGAAT